MCLSALQASLPYLCLSVRPDVCLSVAYAAADEAV